MLTRHNMHVKGKRGENKDGPNDSLEDLGRKINTFTNVEKFYPEKKIFTIYKV